MHAQSLMSTASFEQYCIIAEKVAREAGRVIRESLQSRVKDDFRIIHKAGADANKVDLVTETDRKAEDIIMRLMKAELPPDHQYVGEETAFLEKGMAALTDAPTWFIDPLDGTTNFCHGYTHVCVSIGLYVNKEPAVGVVYNPFAEEMYKGWRGGGAYLNGQRLHVAQAKSIGECLVATTLGSSRDRAYVVRLLGRLQHILLKKIHGFRVSGSTALNMAYVAAGRLDAYYDHGGYGGPWDVAAGAVLIIEAGGVLRSMDGSPFILEMGKGQVIAGNPAVVAEISAAIAEADALSDETSDEKPINSANRALGKWLDKAPTLSLVSTAALVLLSHAAVMLIRGRRS